MKKYFFLLIISIVLQLTNIINCAAQVKRDSIPTKEKDIISASQNYISLENSMIINLYWGGPNLGFVLLKEDNVNLSSVFNIGHFGGSIELMIDNQSSIGLDANYSSSIVNYVNSNFHKKLT